MLEVSYTLYLAYLLMMVKSFNGIPNNVNRYVICPHFVFLPTILSSFRDIFQMSLKKGICQVCWSSWLLKLYRSINIRSRYEYSLTLILKCGRAPSCWNQILLLGNSLYHFKYQEIKVAFSLKVFFKEKALKFGISINLPSVTASYVIHVSALAKTRNGNCVCFHTMFLKCVEYLSESNLWKLVFLICYIRIPEISRFRYAAFLTIAFCHFVIL